MKLIKKSRGPQNLKNHRALMGTDYESFRRDVGLGNYSLATSLRKNLLEDQGYLCAYCMKRIPHRHVEEGFASDKMKIEHYVAQTNATSIANKMDILYSNMFACCMGNHGKARRHQTCDTRKGEDDLTIKPTYIAHIKTIKYAPDGSIHSTNNIFENEIKDILNLNEDNLKKQREAIYKLIEKKVREEFRNPNIIRVEKNQYLDQQIRWWSSKKNGKYTEFCMVAISYLESRKK